MEAPGFRQVLNMSWAIMNTYGMAVDHFARKLYMADFEKTGEFTGHSPALGTSLELKFVRSFFGAICVCVLGVVQPGFWCVSVLSPFPLPLVLSIVGGDFCLGPTSKVPNRNLCTAQAPADICGISVLGSTPVWIVPELFPHQSRYFSHQSWFIPVP